MAIKTNEGDGTAGTLGGDSAQRTQERAYHEDFAGTTFTSQQAPSASKGFLGLFNRIGINKIDKAIEPYLKTVQEECDKALSNVTLVTLDRLPNSYALRYVGDDGAVNYFGLLFASVAEPKSAKYTPVSARLGLMLDEMREMKKDGEQQRVVDIRIVLSDYKPDMDRAEEMANTIVSVFQVSSIPNVKNANVEALIGPEFLLDWRLSEAKATQARLSPQGVSPRMDLGMTLKVKFRNDFGHQFRDLETDFRTVGVIGGYVDFREKEPVRNAAGQTVMKYIPVFNITTLAAHIPLEGIAMMLISSLAPTIYNNPVWWANQFREYVAEKPNLGMLEEDPANRGKPFMVQSQEELLQFVQDYFDVPKIALHFQDGADSIPGMYRLAVQDIAEKSHFASRLGHFVMSQEDGIANSLLSVTIDERIEGVYGESNGVLRDSREIDFFWAATHQGWGSIDFPTRRVLMGGSTDSIDRARLIETAAGNFTPLYNTNVSVINPDFIAWFITKMDARGLKVSDPDGREAARPLGSMLAGFGSGANMGTFVTTATPNRGYTMSSIWNRRG